MDYEKKIEEYNEQFRKAQDLEKGLGQAIADFVTSHEPIRIALNKDLKKLGHQIKALENHRDKRMQAVAVTILNTVHARLGAFPNEWASLLLDLRGVLGEDVFDILVEAPTRTFPIETRLSGGLK